jgi:hypothetical protein
MRSPIHLCVALTLLLSQITFADPYTEPTTGITIDFPMGWEMDDVDGKVATAPDRLGVMFVIAMKNPKDPDQALQLLDINDTMGNQIKSINVKGKPLSKKINGLSATIYTGKATISNVEMPFMAAVVNDKAPMLVVFAYPIDNAHVKKIQTSIDSMRGPGSGK